MSSPTSADISSLSSAVQSLTAGASDPGALDRAFASGSTATGLDLSSVQGLLNDAAKTSSGPSIFDPSYIAISGLLSLFATGLLIYGKKMGEPRYILWGLALFALSYDYTSGPVWAVALLFGGAGYVFE